MTDTNDKVTPGNTAGGYPSFNQNFNADSVPSRQVSWWPTHEFITALVANVNNLPIAGTPAWCALSDTDPAKLIALAAAGEHHVLRVETAQAAMAEASRAVAASTNWRTVGKPRGAAYIERQRRSA